MRGGDVGQSFHSERHRPTTLEHVKQGALPPHPASQGNEGRNIGREWLPAAQPPPPFTEQ